jgi:hypothetical protein
MSFKVGTLVESHLSMICPQTTHLATLLCCWTAANTSPHKGLRNGGKRSSDLPGLRLLEASARLRTRNLLCVLKKINSRGRGRSCPSPSRVGFGCRRRSKAEADDTTQIEKVELAAA